MGIGLMEAVWTQSEAEDSYRLLLIAIANNANDDSRVGWPGIAYLSVRIRKSERQTQRLIHDLAETEDLAVEWGVGRGNTNIYHVLTGMTPQEKAERKELVARINEGQEVSDARRCIQKGDVYCHLKARQTAAKKVTSSDRKGDIQDKKGDIELRKGDTAMSTEPSLELSDKPSVKPSEVAAAADAAPPAPVAEKPSPPVVPSRPKKAGRQETPEETAYYAACVPALAEVCQVDLRVPGEWARCKKPLQALYHATVRPTPALIRQHYGTAGGYWYASDFRGKKGEAPEPHFVQNTWGKATSAAPRVVPASGTNARAAPSKSERTAAAVDEYLRDLRQGPTSGTQILDAQGKVIYG